jgi:hypothetical protein
MSNFLTKEQRYEQSTKDSGRFFYVNRICISRLNLKIKSNLKGFKMKQLIDLKSIKHHKKCVYNENTKSYYCYAIKCDVMKARIANAKITEINDTIQIVEYLNEILAGRNIQQLERLEIIISDEVWRSNELIINLAANRGCKVTDMLVKILLDKKDRRKAKVKESDIYTLVYKIAEACEFKISKLVKLLEEIKV